MGREGQLAAGVVLAVGGLMAVVDAASSPALRVAGALLLAISLGWVVYIALVPASVLQILGAGLQVLLPVAAAVLVIDVVIMQFSDLDTGLKQALVAAVTISAGWLATFLFQEYRRSEDARKRSSDITLALRVEIEMELTRLRKSDWTDMKQRAQQAFARDGQYVPLIPIKRRDKVLQRVMNEIEILEERQIAAVFDYYDVVMEVQTAAEVISSDEYRGMNRARRERLLIDWLETQETDLIERAQTAFEALTSPAESGQ